MATIQITISSMTSTITLTNVAATRVVRGYCRVHNAPPELTEQGKLDWFLRRVMQGAKSDVDEIEASEAARDAAEAKRTENAGDVFT